MALHRFAGHFIGASGGGGSAVRAKSVNAGLRVPGAKVGRHPRAPSRAPPATAGTATRARRFPPPLLARRSDPSRRWRVDRDRRSRTPFAACRRGRLRGRAQCGATRKSAKNLFYAAGADRRAVARRQTIVTAWPPMTVLRTARPTGGRYPFRGRYSSSCWSDRPSAFDSKLPAPSALPGGDC